MPGRSARALLVLFAAITARRLPAQNPTLVPRVQPELRAEATVARQASALAMVGANVPMGFYVRTGLAVGVGAVGLDGNARLAQRADLSVRFLLDPYAETRWGPYAGGGLTVRRDGDERARAGLLLLMGVEGARGRKWRPAVELALGQGTRVAVVFRRARQSGR